MTKHRSAALNANETRVKTVPQRPIIRNLTLSHNSTPCSYYHNLASAWLDIFHINWYFSLRLVPWNIFLEDFVCLLLISCIDSLSPLKQNNLEDLSLCVIPSVIQNVFSLLLLINYHVNQIGTAGVCVYPSRCLYRRLV